MSTTGICTRSALSPWRLCDGSPVNSKTHGSSERPSSAPELASRSRMSRRSSVKRKPSTSLPKSWRGSRRSPTIYDGKVGKVWADGQLAALFEGGEERYNKNVPPGFADSGKKGDDRFGGLVVCKQVIEFAKGKFIPVPRRASLFGMIDDLTTTNRPAGCPFGEADAAVARNARPVRRDAGPPENRSIIRRMGRANPKRLRRRACRSGPLAIRKSRPPGLPVGSPRGGRLGRAKLAAQGIAGQPRTEVAGHGPRREVHLLLDTADFVTGIAHAL